MKRSMSFTRDPKAAAALLAWHRKLQEDPAARARLRRASSPVEAGYEPACYRLLQALLPFAGERLEERSGMPAMPEIPAVAGLSAHVREHLPGTSIAAQLAGAGRRGGAPRVGEGRFRRLLAVEDPLELYAHLARAVRLLGERVDLVDLAEAACRWDPETRQRWAYDYYANAFVSARTWRGAKVDERVPAAAPADLLSAVESQP
jgi:CRISPR type I-E-associated protein CasB/Cse2